MRDRRICAIGGTAVLVPLALVAFPLIVKDGHAHHHAGVPAGAAGELARTGAQEAPCSSDDHRRFDFWIGEWSVTQADGTPAGTNRIRTILDGCVVAEEYSTPEGFEGRSFSTYDARRGVWHQTWVDNANQLLVFEGHWRDSAMVLEGTSIGRDGSPVRHRISWTPDDSGGVRQLWEFSRDDGRTFEVFFDGSYHRAP